MTGTAVQFGAGNIGRGFLAHLFHESGLEVVFVEISPLVLDALNSRNGYEVEIVGPGATKIAIDHVRAVSGRDIDRVANEIANAQILCTAVGANVLPNIAAAIAAGLERRYERNAPPLNILLCENLHDASRVLRDAVAACLPEAKRAAILERTGFVHAVVSRMVPTLTETDRALDPLAVKVEAYKRLPIDADAIVGEWLPIAGIEPVSDFEAHVELKLYTHNCAHAVLGYLGHAAGHEYGYQALRDPRIAALLKAVLEETGQALILKHGFDPMEHRAHVEDLLTRFQNEALGDTCRRLARDPIRKLASDDRLVGSARLCESQGVVPRALAWAIAAALLYEDADDPAAVDLQCQLQDSGREATLRRVCGISPTEKLAMLIDEAMDTAHPPTPEREDH